MGGHEEVAATRRGSKAGEPLADLAFGMLLRRIFQRVRDRTDDLGLVARLPACGATAFAPEAVHDISCVDDASAYTWSPDAQTAIADVKTRGILAPWVAAEQCCWEVRVPGGGKWANFRA